MTFLGLKRERRRHRSRRSMLPWPARAALWTMTAGMQAAVLLIEFIGWVFFKE